MPHQTHKFPTNQEYCNKMEIPDNFYQQQVDECLKLLNNVLGQDLLGVYLYGSAMLGGLQKYSDIDLLVISARATTRDQRTHPARNWYHLKR